MSSQAKIPASFPMYSEKNDLYGLMQSMMEELLTDLPEDPIKSLIEFLSRNDLRHVPRVVVFGAPVSGKKTIARRIAQKLHCVYLDPVSVLSTEEGPAARQIHLAQERDEPASAELWTELFAQRLRREDCLHKGWVLAGFPRTREEALLLQTRGARAQHFVHLDAADSTLVERSVGKRVDPITGDVYHLTFVPPSASVRDRLVGVEGGQQAVLQEIAHYRRCWEGVVSCYQYSYKHFDADQPLDDLLAQVVGFLCKLPRSSSPLLPRVLLLGPPGAGKTTVAQQLSSKYQLANVDCAELLKSCLQSPSSHPGSLMRPFREQGMLIPDEMVLKVLEERLLSDDCTTHGWVLHGYPVNREQAQLLDQAGLAPNRVCFLDAPLDSLLERVSLSHMDPLTGARYHLLYNPPPSKDVKDRLQQNPRDGEDRLKKRLERYQAFLDDLLAFYSTGQHVNADQDPHTVFESVEAFIVNPLDDAHPGAVVT